jgi:hypothetical protein
MGSKDAIRGGCAVCRSKTTWSRSAGPRGPFPPALPGRSPTCPNRPRRRTACQRSRASEGFGSALPYVVSCRHREGTGRTVAHLDAGIARQLVAAGHHVVHECVGAVLRTALDGNVAALVQLVEAGPRTGRSGAPLMAGTSQSGVQVGRRKPVIQDGQAGEILSGSPVAGCGRQCE